MLIKLYLQTENYMQQIREQQEKIELQNSIIAKLKSQLAALNANRGMYLFPCYFFLRCVTLMNSSDFASAFTIYISESSIILFCECES